MKFASFCRSSIRLGLFLLILLAATRVSRAGNTDDAETVDYTDNYFLYGQEEDKPVIDYRPGSEKDPVHPSFIFGSGNGPRVVEFYSPWCPHCQKVANVYVAFAQRLERVTKQMGLPTVEVHAISCKVHIQLCQNFDVHRYPQVHLFAEGATNTTARIVSKRLHPFVVLNRLGIQSDHFPDSKDIPTVRLRSRKKKLPGLFARTKKDIFDDAFRAFDFNMRNGIFVGKGPLKHGSRSALRNWLELLRMTLPPGWKLRPVINAILDDFEAATTDEENLLRILDRFDSPEPKFSESCTKGVPGLGYTCGLWGLFHIMSIGVVQWNALVDQDTPQIRISTVHAADTLRGFIEHFFACEECRTHFLAEYDTCALDRCNRLSPDHTKVSEWMQFPVWLFETHNAVNVRLVKEAAEEKGHKTTAQEEIVKMWPGRKDCDECWREDGAWNETAVYWYLRDEYWLAYADKETAAGKKHGSGKAANNSIEPNSISASHSKGDLKRTRISSEGYPENTQPKPAGNHEKKQHQFSKSDGAFYSFPRASILGLLVIASPLAVRWWRKFQPKRREGRYHRD